MTFSLSRSSSIAALLLFTTPSFAQELDLDRFLRTVLKHNPGVQKILSESVIAEAELQSSQGIDDATLSSSMNLMHSEPNQILGFEPIDSNDAKLNVTYNQLFSDIGTRLSLAYDNQLTDRNPAIPTLGNQYYQSSLTLRLTQPLLKNSGGIQDRLNIELNQINYTLSRLNSQESLESYITQLASLYIDWHLASRELEISKDVYEQAIKQEKLTAIKVKRQVVESYELLRAQETREDYLSRLLQAEGRFNGLMQQIRHQMNMADNASIVELNPRNPKDSLLLTSNSTVARKANYLSTSSNLKSILDSLKSQQNLLLEAKDNAQASDLNVSVGYTRHGIDANFSNVHTSSLDKNDYFVMLEYKRPLGNRQAQGAYQAQLASKQRIEADTQQRLINAEAALANFQTQAAQLTIALKSIDRKIDLASRKLIKEERLFRIGQLDLFELLRDQTAQLESRLNRERLYAQLLVLKLNIGELLDNNLGVYTIDAANLTEAKSEE